MNRNIAAAFLLLVFLLLAMVNIGLTLSSTQAIAAITPTLAPTVTPTITPTSMPGPPELIEPADGATLVQPISPGFWLFRWYARTGPCFSTIYISGPGGQTIVQDVPPSSDGYEFSYQTSEYIPDDQLGPWTWYVAIYCPLGSEVSETRTFWVEPAVTPTPVPDIEAIIVPAGTFALVGEVISVTATLNNNSSDICLGIPQFTISVAPVFEPTNPPPQTFYLAVYPGQSLSWTLPFTATMAGVAQFQLFISAEAGSATCGPPYYWYTVSGISEPVIVAEGMADLAISSQVVPAGTIQSGQPITYTLSYSNTGPNQASNVFIDDLLPSEIISLTYSNDGPPITPLGSGWSIPALAAGQGGTITLTGWLTNNIPAGTPLINLVTISSSTTDYNQANNHHQTSLIVIIPSFIYLPIIWK